MSEKYLHPAGRLERGTTGKYQQDTREDKIIAEEKYHAEQVNGIEIPLTREELENMLLDFFADKKQLLLQYALKPGFADNEQHHLIDPAHQEYLDKGIPDGEWVKLDLINRYGLGNPLLKHFGLQGKFHMRYKDDADEGARWHAYTANTYINHNNGQEYHIDRYRDYNYFPYQNRKELSQLWALAFLRQNYTVSQRPSAGKSFTNLWNKTSVSGSDYGNKVYSDDLGKLVPNSEDNLQTMFTTVSRRIDEVLQNIGDLSLEQQQHFLENEQTFQAVISAVPAEKCLYLLPRKGRQLAQYFNLLTDYQAQDYSYWAANKVDTLAAFSKDEEASAQTGLNLFSNEFFYGRAMLQPNRADELSDEYWWRRLGAVAQESIGSFLAERAVAAAGDEMADFYDSRLCNRGKGSPYSYEDHHIYDLIYSFGLEKAKEILSSNDIRDIKRQVEGWQLLRPLQIDWQHKSSGEIKHLLALSESIQHNGLWEYLQQKYPSPQLADKAQQQKLAVKQQKDNFFKARAMYFLAKQIVVAQNPEKKFYQVDNFIPWERLDFAQTIDSKKIVELFQQHQDIFTSFIFNVNDEQFTNWRSSAQEPHLSVDLLCSLLERNIDLSSLALSFQPDKQATALLAGELTSPEQVREHALATWPQELRTNLQDDELQVFLQHCDQYLRIDKNLLFQLVQNKNSLPQEIAQMQVESKTDLDFKFAFVQQPPLSREYFTKLSSKIGVASAKAYLMRFQSLWAGRHAADWHDLLMWTDNARQFDNQELKELLANTQTVDDHQLLINLIGRYRREDDKLRSSGPIQSVRTLASRVSAIESGTNLANLPAEISQILTAPGFNHGDLKRMQKEVWFRDLCDGVLDKEQPFTPTSKEYISRDLSRCLKEALGERSKGIAGTADDPKKLFASLRQLLNSTAAGSESLKVTDLLQNVPHHLRSEVIALLKTQHVDLGELLTASVHAKSDPEGWVCGNYTDCCMPFGSDKNDDYMRNKSTQYFTIKNSAGRIIAQSVIVDAYDQRNQQDVIVLDNIEVAHNATFLSPQLAKVYSEFWSGYTSLPVKVGASYNDLLPLEAKLEPNHYLPKTQLRYSDARGSQVYNVPKLESVPAPETLLTLANISRRDAKLIAQIERSAYPAEMVQGIDYIQEILEKTQQLQVPGGAASFYVREGKEVAGYTLLLPEASEFVPGQQVAHIYDMAVLPKYRSGKVMFKMWERILESAANYQLPIEAEARGSTTYALLENARVHRWLAKHGFSKTNSKQLKGYLGGEDFYLVRLEKTES